MFTTHMFVIKTPHRINQTSVICQTYIRLAILIQEKIKFSNQFCFCYDKGIMRYPNDPGQNNLSAIQADF